MAPLVVESTVAELASATSIAGTIPAGTVAGNLLVAHVTGNAQAAPSTPPSGWVFIKGQAGDSAAAVNGSATFQRPAQAGDASQSVTFTGGNATASRMSVIIERITGHDPTTPLGATPVSSSKATGFTTYDAPSITTVADDSLVLSFVTKNSSSTATISATSTAQTKAAATSDPVLLGRAQAAFTEVIPTAGATGTRNYTSSASSQWTGIVLAVKPAPAAPVSDTTAPSVPTSVTATANSATQVTVGWSASTDAVGVASYRVRRNGADLPGATAVTGTSFVDTTTVGSTSYSYTVSAVDAAGNRSAESTAATVVTPAPPAADDIQVVGTPSIIESASATSLTATTPAGTVAGETLLAIVAGNAQAAGTTPPTGWALGASVDGVTTSAVNGMGLFTRPATSADAAAGGASYTFTGGSATPSRMSVIMLRLSGVNPGTLFDVAPVTGTLGNGNNSWSAPGISPVNARTRVFWFLSQNSASTGAQRITTTAGPSTVAYTTGATGLGRLQAVFTELEASGGPVGSRLFTSDASSQWAGIVVAIRPASVAQSVGTLQSIWVGIPDGTRAPVKVRTSGAASVRLKIGTNSSLTTGVSYTAAVAPDTAGYNGFVLAGLTQGQKYWCQAEIDGVLNTSRTGSFTTDRPGVPMSFTAGFGSCLTTANTNRTAFDNMITNAIDFFIHLGDWHYDSDNTTSVATHRASMERAISSNGGLADLLLRPTAYGWSDHDTGPNDWTGGPQTWTPSYLSTYGQVVPVKDPLPSGGTYYSFGKGRIKFIMTDGRSFKSLASATDGPSKTMFGFTQEAWIAQELADTNYPVKIIAVDVPWVYPTTVSTTDDKWGSYTAAANRLVSAIQSSGAKVFMIHGDSHALLADNGTSANNRGGLPVAGAAPFGNSTSVKGGPYSQGTWPTGSAVGSTRQQHGLLQVTDTGDSITIRFSGRDEGNVERVSLAQTYATSGSGVSTAAWKVLTGSGWVDDVPKVLTSSGWTTGAPKVLTSSGWVP